MSFQVSGNTRSSRRTDHQQLQAALAARFNLACGGRSHRKVGAALGLPGETVRRYRKGISPVPLHVASRLCVAFEVSPTWLLLGTEAAGAAGVRDVSEQV